MSAATGSARTPLDQFRKALDQTREVSIQEAVYRLMGFPITKASRKVKYISTTDKQQRDGLLKSNLDNLKDGESAFFYSLTDYYENRPDEYENLTLILLHTLKSYQNTKL